MNANTNNYSFSKPLTQ